MSLLWCSYKASKEAVSSYREDINYLQNGMTLFYSLTEIECESFLPYHYGFPFSGQHPTGLYVSKYIDNHFHHDHGYC